MMVNKDGGHIFYTRNGAGESFAEHNEHMREYSPRPTRTKDFQVCTHKHHAADTASKHGQRDRRDNVSGQCR